MNNKIVFCLSLGIMLSLTASKPGEKERVCVLVSKDEKSLGAHYISPNAEFSVNPLKITQAHYDTVWAQEVRVMTEEDGNKTAVIKGSSSKKSGLNYELSFALDSLKELQNHYYEYQGKHSSYFDFGKLYAAKQNQSPKKGGTNFYLTLEGKDKALVPIVLRFSEQQVQNITGITYYYKPARIAALSLSAVALFLMYYFDLYSKGMTLLGRN